MYYFWWWQGSGGRGVGEVFYFCPSKVFFHVAASILQVLMLVLSWSYQKVSDNDSYIITAAWKWKWNRSVVSDSLRPRGLSPNMLLCPWDFPGKSTGIGCLSFSRGSSQPRDWTQVSRIVKTGKTLYHLSHQGSPWAQVKTSALSIINGNYYINAIFYFINIVH